MSKYRRSKARNSIPQPNQTNNINTRTFPSHSGILNATHLPLLHIIHPTITRPQTPPRPPIRQHTKTRKLIDGTLQRSRRIINTTSIREDIETAIRIATPVDAHGVEGRIEGIAPLRVEANGRLRFFAVAAGVEEDCDGLGIYVLLQIGLLCVERNAKNLRCCGCRC